MYSETFAVWVMNKLVFDMMRLKSIRVPEVTVAKTVYTSTHHNLILKIFVAIYVVRTRNVAL